MKKEDMFLVNDHGDLVAYAKNIESIKSGSLVRVSSIQTIDGLLVNASLLKVSKAQKHYKTLRREFIPYASHLDGSNFLLESD